MLSLQERDSITQILTQHIRVMQIIVGALVAGCVAFAVVALAVIRPEPAEEYLLTTIMAAASIPEVVLRFVIPPMTARAALQQLAKSVPQGERSEVRESDAEQICQIYRTTLIIACALFEGAAFMNLMAYLMEGHVIALAIGAIMTVAVAVHLPTTGGVMAWVESKLEEVEAMRSTP